MISCNLLGRLGNQAMISATTIAYALRHGLEYHIPAHTLNDNVWKPVFTHLENPNWNPDLDNIVIRENGHSYSKIGEVLSQVDVNITIDGYRQSLKYFEDYLPEVRKAFGFTYKPIYNSTAALHIRLGDYRLHPTKHPIISKYYISRGVLEMVKNGISNFMVFSDEINDAKKYIESLKLPNFCHFDYSERTNEKEDFQEMLCYSHFIISNSTYSLMAAILSESSNKICISPSKENWFGADNKHLCTDDIIPDNYIQIKY